MTISQIKCPYCGFPTSVDTLDRYQIFPHPRILKNDSIYEKLWPILDPYTERDNFHKCENCKRDFVITFLPNTPNEINQSAELRFFINLGTGLIPQSENKLFVEKLLDALKEKKTLWLIFSVLTILSIYVSLIPQSLTNDYIVFSKNWIFLIYLIVSVIMIYFAQRYLHNLRESLNFNNLKVFLDSDYKKSGWFKVYEEWQLKSIIFGKPYSEISYITIYGILMSGFYLFLKFVYLNSLSNSLYFSTVIVGGHLFVDYMTISELLSLPFGLLTTFVLGTLLIICFTTISRIGRIINDIELDRSLIEKDLETNKFAKIWFDSIRLLGIILIMLALIVYWASITTDAFSNIRQDPFSQIIGFVSVVGIIVIFGWIIFSPIYGLKKKLKSM